MGILRIILAITVVFAHTESIFGIRFTGGLVAVQVFFIISGFYMALILDKKYIGKGSYILFLSNRFLRLYPIYWTILFLTIITSIISYYLTGDSFRLSPYIKYFDIMAIGTLFFQIFTNIVLFGQDIVMFLGMNPKSGAMYFTRDFTTSDPMFWEFLLIPQAWTLGIEVMFYLIAPFIVRKSNYLIASLIILSISIRVFTYRSIGRYDPWVYRFFPSELVLFLLGTVSYRLYKSKKILGISFMGWKLGNCIVTLFFSILLFYQFLPEEGAIGHMINWLFYGFFCLSMPFIFDLSKSVKFDARVGEMSYPIYISHVFVIMLTAPFLENIGWGEYVGEIVIFTTILVSYILVRLISDPIEKIRQNRVKVVHQAKQENIRSRKSSNPNLSKRIDSV